MIRRARPLPPTRRQPPPLLLLADADDAGDALAGAVARLEAKLGLVLRRLRLQSSQQAPRVLRGGDGLGVVVGGGGVLTTGHLEITNCMGNILETAMAGTPCTDVHIHIKLDCAESQAGKT